MQCSSIEVSPKNVIFTFLKEFLNVIVKLSSFIYLSLDVPVFFSCKVCRSLKRLRTTVLGVQLGHFGPHFEFKRQKKKLSIDQTC
jgi:hypothetical protein